jgi:hydrocephalus-inducing protein
MGSAEAPVSEGSIERNVPAKETLSETLRVRNWLATPQRFRLLVERRQAAPATTITGPDYVDVPAYGTKDVRLAFHAYVPGTTTAQVVFKNEASGEYTFYDLKVTATTAAQRGTLALACPVRTQVAQRVTITNPLPTDVKLKGSSSDKQVAVPAEVVVKGRSSAEVEVRYRPLVVRTSEALLTLEGPELGVYEYRLALQGTSTNPERQLTFSVPLGSADTQVNTHAALPVCSWLVAASAAACVVQTMHGTSLCSMLMQAQRWLLCDTEHSMEPISYRQPP